MTIRKTVVAGQFYPNSATKIHEMFAHYNQIIETHRDSKVRVNTKPRAIIVPHAGYIYSGFTASVAYSLLQNTKPKRIIVIGPSHRAYIDGISICDYEQYETPLGALTIDTNLVEELKNSFDLHFHPEAQFEHSTEVQMPFIKHYIPEASVVELVYGRQAPEALAKLIALVLKDPQNAVVISTDLSHYYDINKAKNLDTVCLDAIEHLDTATLHQGCEACGMIGVEAMLLYAKKAKWQPLLLDYRTSADASGDKSQVVGYMSAAFVPRD
ncbi:AmmeMemoRadiSam system protein B [Sulfurospirillum sp. 1612]|uniref:AmmeMemoRadiSam system protein B n=1 Tax=Sulfurospirillum sp. 1612 TaxID=3094835 RepID=UPI002F93FCDA